MGAGQRQNPRRHFHREISLGRRTGTQHLGLSSAISIRNNWDVILKGTGFSYVFVERLADLQRIRPGDFVILTLNKVSQYKKQIGRYIKQLGYKIQFIFDESDNISNSSSKQTLSVLSCFRRCKYKLLTTGTSTRNNISEFAPQLELLYNNSINMISWCRTLYSYDKRSADMEHKENPYYAMPIPVIKRATACSQTPICRRKSPSLAWDSEIRTSTTPTIGSTVGKDGHHPHL